MLPISVEPRAKMKVTARQLPSSSSLIVEPTRLPNCLFSMAGRAAAVPASRATAEANFIVAVGLDWIWCRVWVWGELKLIDVFVAVRTKV